MKILYGIQATGNGHISRSRVMAKYLQQANVEVTYLFSGREKDKLFDMEVFGDFIHLPGLTFKTKDGNIDYVQTMLTNNIFRFMKDILTLDLTTYDLIITDFEPITAWAAKLANKNALAIGHQYAFGDKTPITGESYIAQKIMQYFAPAQQSFGLHWSPYNDNVLPPIIDVELKSSKDLGAILVYLPFEDQQYVTDMLSQFHSFDFIQYAQDNKDEQYGNVHLKPASYHGFKTDLKNASAVICNSGFELNSECIHLGIPILTKPIKGQMEQESNALSLQQLGYGQVMLELDEIVISHWLHHLPTQKQVRFPNVAQELVSWLANEPKLTTSAFAEQLWQQCVPSANSINQ